MKDKLNLIRGPRIETQLEEASTVADLERNTKSFDPKTKKREYAVDEIQVKQLKLIPYHNTGQLEVTGTITSGGSTYDTTIMFDNIEYHETDEPNNVSFVGSDGDEHHITMIQLSRSNVKVRCGCLDFYWRFASYNAKDVSLHGEAPSPYQSRTNRPPVNTRSVPGVCKHLLKTVIALKQTGIAR